MKKKIFEARDMQEVEKKLEEHGITEAEQVSENKIKTLDGAVYELVQTPYKIACYAIKEADQPTKNILAGVAVGGAITIGSVIAVMAAQSYFNKK